METLDKLYVHSYYEYDNLRKWAIAYYPELLFYFLDTTMTYQQWDDNCKTYIKKKMDIAKKEYDDLIEYCGCSGNRDDLVAAKYKVWRNISTFGTLENAAKDVDNTLKKYNMTKEEWKETYSVPVMSTPYEVDKKLLWICPIPYVREYLLKAHCEYKTRWYHKLFFKGKKHFNIK